MSSNLVRILFVNIREKLLPVTHHLQQGCNLDQQVIFAGGVSLGAAPLPGIGISCQSTRTGFISMYFTTF